MKAEHKNLLANRLTLIKMIQEFTSSLPEKPDDRSMGVISGLCFALNVMSLPKGGTAKLEMVEQGP